MRSTLVQVRAACQLWQHHLSGGALKLEELLLALRVDLVPGGAVVDPAALGGHQRPDIDCRLLLLLLLRLPRGCSPCEGHQGIIDVRLGAGLGSPSEGGAGRLAGRGPKQPSWCRCAGSEEACPKWLACRLTGSEGRLGWCPEEAG